MRRTEGFTLIELVAGIVLVAAALLVIITFTRNQASRQTSIIYQIHASELAGAMIHRAQALRFDEESNELGGEPFCGDTGPACTAPASYGSEGSENGVLTFNDIDDLNEYCDNPLSGSDFALALGLDPTVYGNYQLKTCVTSAPGFVGAAGDDAAKRLDLTVILPNSQTIAFRGYWSNY
ncbi:type IV pilus modification PilV family protein [Dongshaea marina]|uniref:type IV pilus modification PilV family protein n=1 Tax=Dongshaea marina TaxID=2047966 RepID=UPI000D3E0B37|nr:type II secretion system protein [Dongshaea marina]